MKNKMIHLAIIAAAAMAAEIRHYDHGIGINRRQWRAKYKKRGGGRGVGLICGLPKSSKYIATIKRVNQ